MLDDDIQEGAKFLGIIFSEEADNWKHRFNSKPDSPVNFDTIITGYTEPFYS